MPYVPPHKRKENQNKRNNSNNDRGRNNDDRPARNDDRPARRSKPANRRFDRAALDQDYDRNDRQISGNNGTSGDIRRSNRFGRSKTTELSTEPNKELEEELFGTGQSVVMGINFDEYDKIPVDVSGVDCPAAIENFDELLVTPALLRNIELCNFQKPTPIQKYSIPTVLANRDLMACAQTGSGKTAAFLIPIVERICRSGMLNETGRSRSRFSPLALILAPTRELAQQIHQQARKLTYRCGMRSCCVYGGIPIREQFNDLALGVHVLVATPGRLWDMFERSKLTLQHVGYLIMDEADRMLDMGFEPQIRQIIDDSDMPQATRRTLMYSATFPDEIQALAQDFLEDYIFLAVGRVGSTTNLITQELRYVQNDQKTDELLSLLPTLDGKVLVFTATKRYADSLEFLLNSEKQNAITIHGDKSQSEREVALRKFRSGDARIMVATDVAARGLDIPNVMWVVQYDLPGNIDDYVHRIGRTGRRGNSGNAIAFTNEQNRPIFNELLRLLQEAKQSIPSWFTKLIKNSNNGRRNFNRNGKSGGRNNRGRHQAYQNYGGRDVREPQQSSESTQKVRVKKKSSGLQDDAW